MIALEDLSVAAGEFRLERITITARDGEYLVLLGPSGAGKTMLLELIAGLRIPDTGTVTINGQDKTSVPPEHRGTALVYQDYSLFPHMTAAENIAYGLKIQGRPVREIAERVDSLLADFKISLLKVRYPCTLSGGEQQRIAIARALATDPSVLLLDEPFASLDPRTRNGCIQVMQELKDRRSITIIQVSHSVDEAYALADRVVVLMGGRVKQAGTPDDVFRNPVSPDVALFVGMENVLTGTVLDSGSGCSSLGIGSETILIPSEYRHGTRITIGIPAGCIHIVSGQPVSYEHGLNRISCRVKRVTWGKDTVTLTLEGEVSLTAVIHRAGDEKQIPTAGTQLFAVFREKDVRVLSGA